MTEKPLDDRAACLQTPSACWPEWAEESRPDDALSADAYDGTPARCRAVVKTGLALAHMHFGQSCGQVREMREDGLRGFWRRQSSHAALWAVVAFTPEYAAAARIAAACAPAMLAGVPVVGAVCVGGTPSPAALVSLELCGVEDIFLLHADGLCALLRETRPGPGRLVLLHTGQLSGISPAARAMGIPCFEENRPPVLHMPHPEIFDTQALAFAQAATAKTAGTAGDAPPDACYLSPAAALEYCGDGDNGLFPRHGAPVYTPGCEGFWLHPGLTPEFFSVRRQAFGLTAR